MKSSSVRGTPINSIKAPNNQGMRAGTPSGMSGTVNRQFEGDQKGNRQVGIASGTPYHSQDGNGPETSRTRSQGKYGVVIGEAGNMADPHANGNGVLLDGISRETGYIARDQHTMDSPVPAGAPKFDTRTIRQENLAHLGQGIGAAPSQAGDDIQAIGGVLSRDMEGTSTPNGGIFELVEDDVLRNKGAGGAEGEKSGRYEKP